MATKLFVNLPVKHLARSEAFFTALGFEFFGMTEDMASVIISDHTQVMLLDEQAFASYIRGGVADASTGTEVILVLGVETVAQVDELLGHAIASGAQAIGDTRHEGGRYQRGFADLDGHHWEALCVTGS